MLDLVLECAYMRKAIYSSNYEKVKLAIKSVQLILQFMQDNPNAIKIAIQ